MTVAELIAELQKIEDQTLEVGYMTSYYHPTPVTKVLKCGKDEIVLS